MAQSAQDSDIELSGKPLIFIPDTSIQRNPRCGGIPYKPPVKLDAAYFGRMETVMNRFCVRAGFEFIEKPLYHIYDNELFNKKRWFWKYVLKRKLPIYVVSPLYGIIWPGEKGGTYELQMDEVFYVWRQSKLWEVTLELYEKLNCDRVFSFLPPLYNNIIYAEGIPWFRFEPEDFTQNLKIFKYIAKTLAKSRDLS